MNRKTRVSRCLLVTGILCLCLTLGTTCKKKDLPPNAPSIPSGPTSGRKGDSLRFSTVAEDPDGDSVAVRFDWGDSTMSDWSALVPSRDSVVMTHAWQRLGSHSITAQARDEKETASVWSGGHQLTVASFSVTFGGTGDDVGNSVQQTSDGGYIIAGYTTSKGAGGADVWLIKTDESGNEAWDRTFGGAGDDYGYSVQQTLDGGYIIAGSTNSYGVGYDDVWLIKTDASGGQVWERTFGALYEDEGHSVQQTADGGYIIAGHTDSYNSRPGGMWLVKADSLGNEVWDKTFGRAGTDAGNSVQQTSDGGYVVAGSSVRVPGTDAIGLLKTDASGNKTWDTTFGGAGWAWGYTVHQTSDGGYIVVGATVLNGGLNEDVYLIKTDAAGNKVWDKTFGGVYGELGESVLAMPDGGYIIAGCTASKGAGGADVWLIKTDESGNEVWDRTLGGENNDDGHSVQQTSDGGYVITGRTAAPFSANADVLLIKTDADGN